MIMGISFSRGVFFHDRNILACAEVIGGTIHVWAEPISLRTICKMWLRVVFTLPWYYQLFHVCLALALLQSLGWLPVSGPAWFASLSLHPLWAVIYLAGFHFVFPRQLKKFHGAEHKVFSYAGEKRLDAWEQVKRANIVNSGCSTNLVTCFFLPFLLAVPFVPLAWSVASGALGFLTGVAGERWLRRYLPFIYRVSAFLQRHVTTQEPDRIHLETAIRSYRLFEHCRNRSAGCFGQPSR